MSDETITISKETPDHKSMDYEFLREEGIRHIQALANKIWSDHNTHDPGITMLEALCYAITDLGFRTDFDIADLLAKAPGVESPKNFFTLAEIATNNPLTALDFKKILLDLPSIKGGELEQTYAAEVGHELRGLYSLFLELEEDEEFGDLNDNSLRIENFDITNPLSPNPDKITIEIEFLPWNSTPEFIDLVDPDNFTLDITIDSDIEGEQFEHYTTFDIDSQYVEMNIKIRTISPLDDINNYDLYLADLTDALNDVDIADQMQNIFKQYLAKRAKIRSILKSVREEIAAYRNLSEDFSVIQPMNLQEIALHGDIEVADDAQAEVVLATVYHKVSEFLNPTIRFHTLEELLDKGKKIEDIFQGPVLKNGFINTDELNAKGRRQVAMVSDVINVIMDVEGVIGVKDLRLSNYVFGDPQQVRVKNGIELAVPTRFLPQISTSKSDITVSRGSGIALTTNVDTVTKLLSELRIQEQIGRLAGGIRDVDIPEGNYSDISDYHAVQEELPATYGTSSRGLPEPVTASRQGQAKQLKAYLLFFEQLLVNYLSQLSNIRSLFSIDPSDGTDRTYFSKPVYSINKVDELLRQFTQYANENLLDMNDPDVFLNYVASKDLNSSQDYAVQLEDIIESTEKLEERKNRFLDHLLARFGESFNEYALFLYSKADAQAPSKLIKAKSTFLSEYNETSSSRGGGFNYMKLKEDMGPDLWNTENVPALKKRAYQLLGLTNYSRKDVSPFHHFRFFYDSGSTQYKFKLVDDKAATLLISSNTYVDYNAAIDDMISVIEFGKDETNYIPASGTPYTYTLQDDQANNLAAGESTYTDDAERSYWRQRTIDYLVKIDNVFGFHLAENILMRPLRPTDTYLIPEEDEDPCLNVDDPYSFRMSVILPAWGDLAEDIDFRRLLKKTLRKETPAHIYLRFYWVSRDQLYEFEKDHELTLQKLHARWIQTNDLQLWLSGHSPDFNSKDARLYDASANNNVAQVYSGTALDFDGTDDYVDCGQVTLSGSSRTFAAWVYSSGNSNDEGIVTQNLTEAGTTFSDMMGLMFTATSNEILLRHSNINQEEDITYVIPGSEWVRVVGTIRGGKSMELYVNGVSVASKAIQTFPFTDSRYLQVGRLSGSYFNGKLADVQVWETSWTAEDAAYDFLHPEKLAFANANSTLTSGSLALRLALSEGYGNIAYDGSDNKYNGTINGTPTSSHDHTLIPQNISSKWAFRRRFNGTTNYTHSTSYYLDGETQWTIALRLSDYQSASGFGFVAGGAGNQNLLLNQNGIGYRDSANFYYNFSGITTTEIEGRYVDFVFYSDGTTIYLVVDGKYFGALTTTPPSTSVRIRQFGNGYNTSTLGVDGFLADIRVWDYNVGLDEALKYSGNTMAVEPNIAWLPLDEPDGTQAFNRIGNISTYNGTFNRVLFTEGATPNVDAVGFPIYRNRDLPYYSFDESGHIQVTESLALEELFADHEGGGVFEAWIKPMSGGASSLGTIFQKGEIQLNINNSAGTSCSLEFTYPFSISNGKWVTNGTPINIGEWNHIVVQYNHGSADNDPVLWVNGKTGGITESTSPDGAVGLEKTSDLFIGKKSDDTNHFDGLMAGIRFYARDLTDNQILLHYIDTKETYS